MSLSLSLRLRFFVGLAMAATMPVVGMSVVASEPLRITVSAGELDRVDSVVRFAVPNASAGTYVLTGEDGKSKSILQVDKDGQGVMIEANLPKGTSRTYEAFPATMTENKELVTVKENGDVLAFQGEAGELLRYQMKAAPVPEGVAPIFAHGAHLHPVFSPSGKVVTGNHPPDHPHHRGIFFAWTKTDYEGRAPDFWNMGKDKSGKLTGEVRFDSLVQKWGGAVAGGFIGVHRHLDHTSGVEKPVLSEVWNVAVYRPLTQPVAMNVFDLVSAQQLVGNEPLKLPKYHYGGLGVRGSAAWDAVEAVSMLTSNGDDRKSGDSTKAKWVYLGGEVDGGKTGMVVLIHPDNFRFPQALRLNPKNPQLCVAPSQDGDWAIEAEKSYVSRYRFVVMDGVAEKELLERLWLDYATPISVKVGK